MASETLHALTLHAPWAYAVAHLGKRIENRTWKPPARIVGRRLAIHAGLRNDARTWDAVTASARAAGIFGPARGQPQFVPPGSVVAVATVDGFVDATDPGDVRIKSETRFLGWGATRKNHWWIGPVGWLLADVMTLPEPAPCSGRQGLWRLSPDVDAAVRAQLGGGR